MKELELAEKYLIFKCLAGSKSYGTDTETSDIDTRGIFIAPPEYILGCLKNVGQVEVPGEDTTIYELGKFVQLAANCNPNIIELLFTKEKDVLFIDPAFEELRFSRNLFLSKKAKYTFSGYAMAQMKRIRGHNKWINNPMPKDAPEMFDFAKLILPDGTMVAGEGVESFVNVFLVKVNATVFRVYSSSSFSKPPLSKDRQNLQYIDIDSSGLSQAKNLEFFGTLIVQEEAYRVQHRKWKDYWKWKKNRNEARAELEEHYGFDTKHAMHLIRLLKMSHEILRDGEVIVHRPDAEELVAIRNGSFDYKELVETAERMCEELEELAEKSSLPESADMEAINSLYMGIVQAYWRRVGLANEFIV